MMTFKNVAQLRGADVLDQTGSKLGTIIGVFLDGETKEPTFVSVDVVDQHEVDGDVRVLPFLQATVEGRVVQVPYTVDQINSAPKPEGEDGLTPADERRICDHYGVEYSG